MRCLDLEWEMGDLTLCFPVFSCVFLCFPVFSCVFLCFPVFSVFSDCPLDSLAAVKEFLANVGPRGVYS